MTTRGRPTTGVKVQVRIPADLLAYIDDYAKCNGITRAETMRHFLAVVHFLAPESGGPSVD
jgi:hypothetical protein